MIRVFPLKATLWPKESPGRASCRRENDRRSPRARRKRVHPHQSLACVAVGCRRGGADVGGHRARQGDAVACLVAVAHALERLLERPRCVRADEGVRRAVGRRCGVVMRRPDQHAVTADGHAPAELVVGGPRGQRQRRLLRPGGAAADEDVRAPHVGIRPHSSQGRPDDRRVAVDGHAGAEQVAGRAVGGEQVRLHTHTPWIRTYTYADPWSVSAHVVLWCAHDHGRAVNRDAGSHLVACGTVRQQLRLLDDGLGEAKGRANERNGEEPDDRRTTTAVPPCRHHTPPCPGTPGSDRIVRVRRPGRLDEGVIKS